MVLSNRLNISSKEKFEGTALQWRERVATMWPEATISNDGTRQFAVLARTKVDVAMYSPIQGGGWIANRNKESINVR